MNEINLEQGKKELEILRELVTRWRQWAEDQFDGTPGWEFLADELSEKINAWGMVGYVRRLRETEHITTAQEHGFYGWCIGQVEELRQVLTDGRDSKKSRLDSVRT